jgi:hypothetical protein
MDAPARGRLRSRMARPFEQRERWRDVSRLELDAFLRRYPRRWTRRAPGTGEWLRRRRARTAHRGHDSTSAGLEGETDGVSCAIDVFQRLIAD